MEEQVLITKYICQRCNHKWIPRKEGKPVACPKCHSPYWNKLRINPSKKTGNEKA